MDLKGSFITRTNSAAYSIIQELLASSINQIFDTTDTNFLSLSRIPELSVKRGDNNLDTCFQYVASDKETKKLLFVKAYDKLIDLIAREGSFMVGSRASVILGSKHHLGKFEKKITKVQHNGLTRLEISICKDALRRFNPFEPSVKSLWHFKV